MNLRYVLMLSALLLFLVDAVAREGGAIDQIAMGGGTSSPPSEEAPQSVVATVQAPESSSDDFFANYEPPDGHSDFGVIDPDSPRQQARQSFNSGPPVGSLSDEELGVEKSVGLAVLQAEA